MGKERGEKNEENRERGVEDRQRGFSTGRTHIEHPGLPMACAAALAGLCGSLMSGRCLPVVAS